MDKGWSRVRAHWTPAAPVGKVRVRAQAAGARERKDTDLFLLQGFSYWGDTS